MALKKVLKNIPVYFNGYNISGASNDVKLDAPIDELPATSFADLAKNAEPGLEKVSGTVAIMVPDDMDLEAILFAARGQPALISFFTGGTTIGSSSEFSAYGLSFKHYPGGQVGALLGTTIELAGKGVPLLRGTVLENEGDDYDEASTEGNYIEITGGVPDGYRLYLILHVLEFTGLDGLVLALESDVDNTFGAPNTQVTSGNFTDSGFALLSVDGEITDEFFRLAFTPDGTGTFKLAAALALVAI